MEYSVFFYVMVGVILVVFAMAVPSLLTKKCPKCGTRVWLEARECKKCGILFPEDNES